MRLALPRCILDIKMNKLRNIFHISKSYSFSSQRHCKRFTVLWKPVLDILISKPHQSTQQQHKVQHSRDFTTLLWVLLEVMLLVGFEMVGRFAKSKMNEYEKHRQQDEIEMKSFFFHFKIISLGVANKLFYLQPQNNNAKTSQPTNYKELHSAVN